MPTYSYHCSNCNHACDVFHKISQEPLKHCPKCHKDTLQRKIGGAKTILNFKGDGFYITDYQKKKTPSKQDSSDS